MARNSQQIRKDIASLEANISRALTTHRRFYLEQHLAYEKGELKLQLAKEEWEAEMRGKVNCSDCGNTQPEEHNFCDYCGAVI